MASVWGADLGTMLVCGDGWMSYYRVARESMYDTAGSAKIIAEQGLTGECGRVVCYVLHRLSDDDECLSTYR